VAALPVAGSGGRTDIRGPPLDAGLDVQDISRPRILVIEDEPDIREEVGDLLRDFGYEVECAADGAEAFEHLGGGFSPGLILLDLMMPVMDGRTFLARFRAEAANDPVPVVVMTAQRTTSEKGAVAVLSKPFDVDELLELVKRLAG